MSFLNKEQFKQRSKSLIATLKKEEVVLTDQSKVYVREMTAKGADEYEASMLLENPETDGKGNVKLRPDIKGLRVKLAICTICDEEGELLFNMSDVSWLGDAFTKGDLDKITEVADKLNDLKQKTETAKKN